MATNRTQRLAERNEFINERVRQTAYMAFYQWNMRPTIKSTFYSEKLK